MSDYTTIRVIREGAVDWVTLNRPERPNAINGTMVGELWASQERLRGSPTLRISRRRALDWA